MDTRNKVRDFCFPFCFSSFILLIIRILQALIILLEYLCSRSGIYWCLKNDSKSVTYSETRVARDNWASLTYYPRGSKQQIQTRGSHLSISNNFNLLCGISLVSNLPPFCCNLRMCACEGGKVGGRKVSSSCASTPYKKITKKPGTTRVSVTVHCNL